MGFLSGSLVFLSPSIFPKVAALGRLLWSQTAFKPGAVRNSPGRWLAVSVIAASWLVSALPAHAGQRIPQRHVQSITKRFAPIKRLESSTRLDLAIGLPLRNRDKLTNLLQELYRPSSPNFRHFLTPEQFAASFGPSEKDYQAVINFAKSRGLIVKRTHSNRTLLDVSG